jgi:hypothetical protein
MTGLHARTGRPIWMVRTAIEVTVLVIGWALGGNVGVGTLAFALLVGPLCSLTLPFFAIRLPQDAATAAAGVESELEGTAEQSAGLEGEQDAVRFDVRDGILLESDRSAHDRGARVDSPFVRGPQPDRAPRPPVPDRAERPSRQIAAHWLDDRITRRPRHP